MSRLEIKRALSTGIVALSILSCAKDVPVLSPEGRTQSIFKPMVFVASGPMPDSISLYDGTGFRRFDKKPGPAGVSYYGEANDNGTYCVIGPYNSNYKMEDCRVLTNIPKMQTAAVDVLDTLHSVFAAVSDDGSIDFSRISSAMKISLEQTGITSVTLRGNRAEMMAGNGNVDFKDGITIQAVDDSASEYSVCIVPETGEMAAGTYYFSLFPSVFKNGVSMTFSRSKDSRIAVIKKTEAISVGGGATFDLGNIIPEDLEWNDVISLIFMEAPTSKTVQWPFKESVGSAALTTKVGDYQFVVSSSGINEIRSGSGFVFGPEAGDHINLPHFKGRALSNVRLVTGNSASTGGAPAITLEDGTVLGSAWTGNKNAGDEMTWSFRGEEDMPVRLQLTESAGDQACAVQILELQYREAKENEYFVDDVETSDVVECNVATGKAKASFSFKMSNPDYGKYKAGVEYRETSDAEWKTITVQPASATVGISIGGLTAGREYEVRAWAQGADDSAPVYGKTVTFLQQTAIKMIFGTESTATDYYDIWKALWNLSKSSTSAVKGPDDKTYSYCDETLTFTLWSSCGYGYRVASSKYYGLCLAYAAAGKDNYNGWMKLPAISGAKLSKVTCKMQGAANYDITIAPEVDSVTGIPVSSIGSASPTGSSAKEYNITVKGAEIGKSYYLCTGTGLTKIDAGVGRMATFEYLILVYE